MSTFDEIQMRHGKRRTIALEARRPEPYVITDDESVKNAKKEPTEKQKAFLAECFLIDRDMQVLLNAITDFSKAWRTGAAYSEFEFFVTDAWNKLPVNTEEQKVIDRRLAEEE